MNPPEGYHVELSYGERIAFSKTLQGLSEIVMDAAKYKKQHVIVNNFSRLQSP